MTGPASRVPAWSLAVTAMLSVQLGSALSLPVIAAVGAGGTAWLRLSVGALVFLALTRPSRSTLRTALRGPEAVPLFGLGLVTGLQTVVFLAAIDRIPLGTTVAIEFLGPLTVAALRSHRARALVWPLLALAGVLLLTRPWDGADVDPLGLVLAVVAAVCWGLYIVLTQHIGDRLSGLSGLSVTVPIAAATAAVVGIPQAAGHLTLGVLAAAVGLAFLLPVLPYALELLALRRMTPTAFGTLMALEPGFAVVLGLVVLHQTPSPAQVVGIVLVVLAGAAAQYGGLRHDPDRVDPATLLDVPL